MRLNSWIYAFIVALLVMLATVIYSATAQVGLPRMDSLTATFTADGDCIKAYVLRDPDTQIEYLVTDHGGITPRLNK